VAGVVVVEQHMMEKAMFVRRRRRERREPDDSEEREFRKWKREKREGAIDARLLELKSLSGNGLVAVPRWAVDMLADTADDVMIEQNVDLDVQVAVEIVRNVLGDRQPYACSYDDEEETERRTRVVDPGAASGSG
jgi:hypothetical protein